MIAGVTLAPFAGENMSVLFEGHGVFTVTGKPIQPPVFLRSEFEPVDDLKHQYLGTTERFRLIDGCAAHEELKRLCLIGFFETDNAQLYKFPIEMLGFAVLDSDNNLGVRID